MPSRSGEQGGDTDFGISSESVETSRYDPQIIADEAVWPLVNHLWAGGDWLKDSLTGQTFEYPRAEVDESNHLIYACLRAEKRLDDDESGSPFLCSSATLLHEEVLDDSYKESLVSIAINEDPEILGLYPDIASDEGVERITAKKVIEYAFYSDNKTFIDLYHILEDPYTASDFWCSHDKCEEEDTEEEEPEEVVFRVHDIDVMKKSFLILGSPQELIDELEWIRQEPITPN